MMENRKGESLKKSRNSTDCKGTIIVAGTIVAGTI
jgi:hypothetical protein